MALHHNRRRRKLMTQDSGSQIALANNLEIAKEMAQLGVTRVPVDNFYYREFHYTRLEDALAQVERDRARVGLSQTT
jgi:hypothetical protein